MFMGIRVNNYAFIDSQNLNLAIRDQGWALDFKRLRKFVRDMAFMNDLKGKLEYK